MKLVCRRPPGCGGFSLVELLVSLLIAALVFATLLTILHVATSALEGQTRRAGGIHAASLALDEIRTDLGGAFASDAGCGMTFLPEENEGWSWTFCTIRPEPGTRDLRWADTFAVTYSAEPSAEGVQLLRAELPVPPPADMDEHPVHTNVILRQVESVTVELYDGSAWRPAWPANPREPGRLPRSARVTIRIDDHNTESSTLSAEILIPAGNTVTSTVVRETRIAP